MSHAATLFGDQPVSRAGASALVSALLVVWLGLIVGLGATDAFVATPGTPPLRLLVVVLGPVIAFLIAYRMVRGRARVCVDDRSPLRHGDTGMAIRRVRVPGALYLRCVAGLLRLAGGTGRYGDRGRRAVDTPGPGARARVRREPEICELERAGDSGSHRRRHRWGRCAAAISQRDQFDTDGRDDASPTRVDPWRSLCRAIIILHVIALAHARRAASAARSR